MRTLEPFPWLTWALLVDAATCAAIAAVHLLGGNALADALALPHGLWRGVGVFLVPWSALLLWLARSPRLSAEWVLGVIVGNGLWALAALGLLGTKAFGTTAWGQVYLALHGVGVLLAIVEWLAWRHSSAVAAGRAARA